MFDSDEAVRRIGRGFLDGTLPRADWTHEAHLATCLWIIRECREIQAERDLPDLIRRFNEALGGVNDDSQGYHDTITAWSIHGVRRYLDRQQPGESLLRLVNGLLASEEGRRDWPLRFYSRELLFSVEARRGWVEPDLQPLAGD
jgi:hypothetical protein